MFLSLLRMFKYTYLAFCKERSEVWRNVQTVEKPQFLQSFYIFLLEKRVFSSSSFVVTYAGRRSVGRHIAPLACIIAASAASQSTSRLNVQLLCVSPHSPPSLRGEAQKEGWPQESTHKKSVEKRPFSHTQKREMLLHEIILFAGMIFVHLHPIEYFVVYSFLFAILFPFPLSSFYAKGQKSGGGGGSTWGIFISPSFHSGKTRIVRPLELASMGKGLKNKITWDRERKTCNRSETFENGFFGGEVCGKLQVVSITLGENSECSSVCLCLVICRCANEDDMEGRPTLLFCQMERGAIIDCPSSSSYPSSSSITWAKKDLVFHKCKIQQQYYRTSVLNYGSKSQCWPPSRQKWFEKKSKLLGKNHT